MVLKKLLIIPTLLFLTFSPIYSAENRAFPQSEVYDHCIQPDYSGNNLASEISEFFFYWKNKYLTQAGSTPGGYYIKTTGSTQTALTVSEAHGYGLLTFALMAGDGQYADSEAKTIFDGMFHFFSDHPSRHGDNLMSWAIYTDNSGGEQFKRNSAATDGDLDIAYALLLAHDQWGSDGQINYLEEAQKVIADIKKWEMNNKNNMVMIADNEYWADPNLTVNDCPDIFYLSRCSDWMADHFRAYSKYTNDGFWDIAVDTIFSVYNYVIQNYSPSTGLTPGFVNQANHEPFAYGNNQENLEFTYDACRVPWRIATDYVHYESSKSKTILNKLSDWIISKTNGDPWEIKGGYTLAGNALVTWETNCFTAPLLCACMADKSSTAQDFLDEGWKAITYSTEDYYEDSINLLCMLLMTGNWWKPEAPTEITDKNTVKEHLDFSMSGRAIKNSITVSYSLNKSCSVTLNVYAINGKQIHSYKNDHRNTGNHTMTIALDNGTVSNGIYLGELTAGGERVFAKVNILK